VELPPHTQENTKRGRRSISLLRNYLRARGEYKSSLKSSAPSQELPPRTRRILAIAISLTALGGTTSAYAENTLDENCEPLFDWNYLRVRGEYTLPRRLMQWSRELPPRARRILGHIPPSRRPVGTTSACAENTFADELRARVKRNYLRVRGEYPQDFRLNSQVWELPPRARRIHYCFRQDHWGGGTTSACAENTRAWQGQYSGRGNYLRVRGEYKVEFAANLMLVELPPRARRIPLTRDNARSILGTTSACAENTQCGGGCL